MKTIEEQASRELHGQSAVSDRTLGSALIVVNPTAGGFDPQLCAEVEAQCLRMRMSVNVRRTTRPGDAVEIVDDTVRGTPDIRLVIVVGGDGTVREVAEGLARGLGRWPHGSTHPVDRHPALFIVPAGTGNSLYRALWGDAPWTDSMGQVLHGEARVRALDLARLVEFDRAVFLGASVGLTARITELAANMRHVPGRQRYWLAAATALTALDPFAIDIEVDGVAVYRGPVNIVAVGGGRHRAGVFQLLPRSVLDDGLLDVCVVGELAPEEIEAFAELIPGGDHLSHPAVRYAQGGSVCLKRSDGNPMLVEIDGDIQADITDRVTLRIVLGAVPVLAPVRPLAG